ncbi:MAG: hypothetical protein IJ341_01750 [Bacteroidales bacterium]|nr:hypothetical protein [Bacteroidales bacterium]
MEKKEILEVFKTETNPYGIPYEDMTVGKYVIVDIPIHDGTCAEVEGIISRNIFYDFTSIFYGDICYSQIKLTKQNTKNDVITLGKGLHAIYPEKIKRIVK